MTDDSLKKIDQYLQSNHHDLQFLFTKIHLLKKINEQVMPYLDPHLAKYCQVANFADHKLVFITANAAIATQLRFQSPELLKRFRQDPSLKNIYHIECKVRPSEQFITHDVKVPDENKMPLLSSITAASVREIAQSLSDPLLKEIMERIAEREKK